MAKRERQIVIPNWDRFQHYTARRPAWIKNYTELLDDQRYLKLTPNRRALLHGLWLMYASSRRELTDNTSILSSRLRQRVTSRDLAALNHAGFIRFSFRNPEESFTAKEKRREKTSVGSNVPADTPPDDWTLVGDLLKDQTPGSQPRKAKT
ncbi:MAG TPA: hypothetical protein VFB50_01000 [Chloroflexota bacterium]|nr:hypothetical protein [Chloroflexota bacterium]